MKFNRSAQAARLLTVVLCALLIFFSTFASAQIQFNFNLGQNNSGSGQTGGSTSRPQNNANTPKPGLPTLIPHGNKPTATPRANKPTPTPYANNPSNASGRTMYVVNCKEWVSLRASASTLAPVLAQVPFGSQVTVYTFETSIYAYCSYRGMNGYIMTQYLADNPSNERADYSTPGVKGNAEQTMEYSGFWTIYPNYEPFNGSKFGSASPSTVMGEYLFRVGSRRYQVYKCESFVSLREEANSNSDCIIEVPKGAMVDVNGELNNWMLCRYKGRYGWIRSNFLTRK